MIKVINPANEKLVAEYAPDSPQEIETRLQAAAAAFESWRKSGIEQRARRLSSLAVVLRSRRSNLAAIAAQEMGKPIAAGESEISKCAAACEHFAQHAAKLLEPAQLVFGGGRGYSRFDPLGPILGIMPWNYPFWQVIRFASASLAAGNVVVLKHAPGVPGCAAALSDAFRDAGFPPGVFTSLRVEDDATAQKLCQHDCIAAVTLTGSERAGRSVAATAGAALKKTVLELGGSDPFIVLNDADIDFAAANAAESRCINTGQSCIAAKRFIVEAEVFEKFQAAFAVAMHKRKSGDPLDKATEMGPLARKDLLDNLQRQVDATVQAGARILIGGRRQGTVGFFYSPTVLTNVQPGMPAFDEETFGPVAAVTIAKDAAEAIALANHSRFGLGASIWTRDLPRAEQLAADINTGNVFINSIVRSDPRLAFGGVKNSGWGRELAEAGLKEFTNAKTVWVNKA
jgi:succinate-semialdehyde dehydrogenase/glutarate-semialdehyde dehydrogenase